MNECNRNFLLLPIKSINHVPMETTSWLQWSFRDIFYKGHSNGQSKFFIVLLFDPSVLQICNWPVLKVRHLLFHFFCFSLLNSWHWPFNTLNIKRARSWLHFIGDTVFAKFFAYRFFDFGEILFRSLKPIVHFKICHFTRLHVAGRVAGLDNTLEFFGSLQTKWVFLIVPWPPMLGLTAVINYCFPAFGQHSGH